MRKLTFREAMVEAIREEMNADERIFLLGQDAGIFGGFMGSTQGLWEEFGSTGRIIDAPMSESAMVGACIGSAFMGLRPIVDISFAEFLPLVMHHLVNDAANMWNYTLGKTPVPLVLRTKFGAGPDRLHHQNFESWFIHVPGLKVVMPSTPYDAKGLLKSAIRDNNPVIFFEHMGLYDVVGKVPNEEYTLPLGVADVKRKGSDVSVVGTAMMVQYSLCVAEKLSHEGIEVEVIDLQTVSPFDKETILSSVRKTGRLVVVHEAWKTGGWGGEIAAMVAEENPNDTLPRIVRIGAPHIPIPMSPPLEKLFLPGQDEIETAIRKVLVR